MARDTSTVARPYAKAAFEFAQKSNELASWSEFLELAASVTVDPSVQQLLIDPRVGSANIVEFYIDICTKALDEKRKNFLLLLAENDRLNTLPDIMGLFEAYKADYENRIEVNVLSSMPLNQEQRDKLTAALEKRLKRDVELNCNIDENLVGGAVIRAGDLVIDGSITTRLARMREELTTI